MSLPLVSFCLKAYNQREYIGAALEGALAQTYRPLEIVICDDHSTDGTWETIFEFLKKRNVLTGTQGVTECDSAVRVFAGVSRSQFRNSLIADANASCVQIILHRNETNLGNCKNWEQCGVSTQGRSYREMLTRTSIERLRRKV